MPSDKDAYVTQLKETFGDKGFTSIEACEELEITFSEFLELFVCLNQHSGPVQKVATRNRESVYKVVEDGE